ncbi:MULTISPECIES: ATP-binding protein [unclassified Fusibacter]|uniref:ATP-binding protein n=1 Tax=unclassified Fusibacter TaxID=2624464 RepID=UPI001011F681|nr:MULTISPECIES: ATP-binding protein [unclassified Fusibacter]MCK8060886.1 ATP-binding protein [Fusibacter sp. A2]NPE23182.1 ATP-binding protein [Fusibacter sp. A1]RXV59540.1 AAA family ATPase [Fusibacter sp. A1]
MTSIYKTIMRDYEKKRDTHEREQARRKIEVYNKLPRLKAIDQEIANVGVEIARTVFSHPENAEFAAKQIQTIAQKLKKEKFILLTDNNYPIDYLNIKYDCDLCKDTGFNEHQKRCVCFRQKLIEHAYEMSNISTRLQRENFTTFDLSLFSKSVHPEQGLSVHENMASLLATSEMFVSDFKVRNGDNLLMYGNTGLGKTFMCSCIAKSLIDKGHSVIYQTAFKLLDTVQLYKFSDKQNSMLREAYDMLFTAELLIIDDLGTEMINSFTQTEIFNIINSRLLSERKTVISTNMSPIELSKAYGERISSRLFGSYEMMEFFGSDLRLK